MIVTLPMLGIAIIRACTATLRPSFREITLRGRKIRNSLNTLNAFTDSLFAKIEITEKITIMKSRIFQYERMYDYFPLNRNPLAIIFITHSIINTPVII